MKCQDHVKIYTDELVDFYRQKSGAGYFNQKTGESFYVPTNRWRAFDHQCAV